MKNLLYVFLVVATMAISCTNGNSNGNGNVADADSTYQWENVRKYLMEEPERALRMLDTAEIRGVMNMNEANHWRAYVYYDNQEIQDFDKAKDYCLMVLNNTNHACDSAQYLKTLNLLVGIIRMTKDYPEGIRYAAQLVATTNDPVGLIVEQSGFSSRSHFNTLFREKFKMTPSEYRNIAKEKNL